MRTPLRHIGLAACGCAHPCACQSGCRVPTGASMRLHTSNLNKGPPGLPLCRLADKESHSLSSPQPLCRRNVVFDGRGRRRQSRAASVLAATAGMWVSRRPWACLGLGLFAFCFFAVGVFLVCVSRFRCCFAAWLREPGGGFVPCAGSACLLSGFCSGASSCVPGSRLSSAAVFAFPPGVAGRRAVCLRWLRACGLPAGLGLVSPCWWLPFPSVLSAGWRAGLLPRLWAACLAARARRRRAGLGC